MNGTQGHALADVARTSLMLTIGVSPNTTLMMRLMLGLLRKQFHQIKRWLPVVAAARVADNIPGEAPHLKAYIAPVVNP